MKKDDKFMISEGVAATFEDGYKEKMEQVKKEI